jgi:hypothetical protein
MESRLVETKIDDERVLLTWKNDGIPSNTGSKLAGQGARIGKKIPSIVVTEFILHGRDTSFVPCRKR